jgi:ComF family protein
MAAEAWECLAVNARCVFGSQSDTLTLDVPSSDISRWRAVVRVLRSPMDALGCALFPASCCVCSNPLLRFTSTPVCDPCWNLLPAQSGTLCTICGEDLGVATFSTGNPRPAADCFCRACSMAPPPFRRAVSHGVYQGTMRALVHAFKYDRITPLADRLGAHLASAIATLAPDAPGKLLVVPVPLHGSKKRNRGFNQAELLARGAIKSLRQSSPSFDLQLAVGVLMRSHTTASQFGLTLHQRRENLRGVFSVPNPARVAGRDVLLVDDIYTSGATARACSKALLKAGAASVWVATLARAQREGVAFWNPNFGKTAGAFGNPREPVSSSGS